MCAREWPARPPRGAGRDALSPSPGIRRRIRVCSDRCPGSPETPGGCGGAPPGAGGGPRLKPVSTARRTSWDPAPPPAPTPPVRSAGSVPSASFEFDPDTRSSESKPAPSALFAPCLGSSRCEMLSRSPGGLPRPSAAPGLPRRRPLKLRELFGTRTCLLPKEPCWSPQGGQRGLLLPLPPGEQRLRRYVSF